MSGDTTSNGDEADAASSVTSRKKIPIVFYDLDGTLIKPKSGAEFPKSRDDFMWWHTSIPSVLAKEHAEGKHLVVISNQGDSRAKVRAEWKAKLPLFADKVRSVSLPLTSRTDRDGGKEQGWKEG